MNENIMMLVVIACIIYLVRKFDSLEFVRAIHARLMLGVLCSTPSNSGVIDIKRSNDPDSFAIIAYDDGSYLQLMKDGNVIRRVIIPASGKSEQLPSLKGISLREAIDRESVKLTSNPSTKESCSSAHEVTCLPKIKVNTDFRWMLKSSERIMA